MNRRVSRSSSDVLQTEVTTPKMPRRSTGGTPASYSPPHEEKERVKVVVRVRPPQNAEIGGGLTISEDKKTITLQRRNSNVVQSDFTFDKILDENANQEDVYEAAVRPVVADVLTGYNGTIMAYGQTGAGKTYTLSSVSSADNIGMMPRAANDLFNEIRKDPSHTYNVLMSYVQIYMELIQDLLKPANENLQIREGPNGVFVGGVEEQPVCSTADCLRLMQLGDQNRTTAFTALNAHSSRSHAIIMLTVVKRRRNGSQESEPTEEKMKVGKLFIVDLAGSERLKKSHSTGVRASEAKAINQSLTTLGICINSRADRTSKHTPFRDSKLTRLLQESLGGNAKTSLVVAIANATDHGDETLQSLQFGSRAIRVQTRAVVNESQGGKLLNPDVLAKLANMEVTPCQVDASLLAKEEEIEKIQEALQGERERAERAIADMRAQQESQQAMRDQELNAAQAEICLRQQQADLKFSELEAEKEKWKLLESVYERQIERLQISLGEADQKLKEADQKLARADAQQQEAVMQARQEAEQQLRQSEMKLTQAEAQRQAAVEEAKRQAKAEMDALVKNLNIEMQEERREHLAALAEANVNLEEMATQSTEDLDRLKRQLDEELSTQKQRYTDQLKAQTEDHSQALQALQAKLDAQSQAAQRQEQLIAELSSSVESRDAEAQLMLESLAHEHEAELSKLSLTHKAELDSLSAQHHRAQQVLREELQTARDQAKAQQQSLRETHTAELAEAEDKHRVEVDRLAAIAEQLKSDKAAALEESSTEYCKQLAAVALEHQRAKDTFHSQLRTLEAESQQAQEGLKEHYDQKLRDAEGSHNDRVAELQAQLVKQDSSKQKLLEEFEMRTREWTASRSASEKDWQKKLSSVSSAADRKLRAAEGALQAERQASVNQQELSQAALADLQDQLEGMQRQHADLADAHSIATSKHKSLREALTRSERHNYDLKRQVTQLSNHLAAKDARDEQLQELWKTNRRNHRAARTIQKHWKAWQIRILQLQNARDRRALMMAHSTHGRLEDNCAQMEDRSHQQNVWTGHQMVAASLQGLEETIQLVRTAFLLPQKELKQYSNLKTRMSLSPASSSSPQSNYSPSLLGRNLSFISQSSNHSFISKAGLQEGPLGSGSSSAFKLMRPSAYGSAANIQAHWGTPGK